MPIITISRLYGSGGSEVAAHVAASMGWSLLDNELIDAVAQRAGVSKAEVASREERRPSLVERLANALSMSTPELLSPATVGDLPPSEAKLLDITRRVVEEAADFGPVVIVGRAAPAFLGARHDVFSVLCVAPHHALVARTMTRDQLDEAAATKRVDEVNKHRQEWNRVHFNRDWRAPELYHLCVNTHALGIHGAAKLIEDVARRTFGNF